VRPQRQGWRRVAPEGLALARANTVGNYWKPIDRVRIVLPGQPGSEAFMLAYQAALTGQELCNTDVRKG
jgi:hypothetical protein